ncbi:MAG: glycosyltransferase [Alphaproteobacteria bacterium]|nr:glycosyltransferase [Alphaproteobacteria bacterium]
MPKKVLYIGVGNPIQPSSGMDVVLREHILELIQCRDIELRGIIVEPGVAGAISSAKSNQWPNFTIHTGDLQREAGGASRVIKKLKSVLFNCAPLAAYAFQCDAAKREISTEISKPYDLVIIDHLLALCNIPFSSLLALKYKIILIAHDAMPLYLLGTSKLKTNILAKLFLYGDAIKAWIVEAILVKHSALTVFLSRYDEQFYGWLRAKTLSLCPILTERQSHDNRDRGHAKPYITFVGGTGFLPNKAALEWIINHLSPALAALDASISIMLVGKGSADLPNANKHNIRHIGFVSDEQLSELLREGLAVISPVVHGGGIKIKVLEAVMAGSPIVATAESLRGFEFLDIVPTIKLDNPEAAAQAIVRLKNDPAQQEAMRQHIISKWDEYCAANSNQLTKQVLAA